MRHKAPGLPFWLAGLLLIGLFVPWLAAVAQTATVPRIGVVTMTPGDEYWARFGHTAIVVDDPQRGTALSYNYGYFDFDQPGFFTRFLRGQMLYRLVVMRLDEDLQTYADEGRGVSVQWLNLSPEQVQSMADFLAWNARAENAEYHYNYFTDNCTTRVRDVLDRVLKGSLSRQLSGRSRGLTYRSEALRLGSGIPWLYLGMHVGLGGRADKPLSIWEESFVPQRLADALARTVDANDRPLVSETVELMPDRLHLESATAPDNRWLFTAIGLGLAGLMAFLLRQTATLPQRYLGAGIAALFWSVCGLGGMVLAALWGLTDHTMAHGNENLLLLNPAGLLLLGALPALVRGQTPPRWLSIVAGWVAGAAVMALFLRFLPFRLQNNGDFVVLLGPLHAVLAWRLHHRA